MGQFPDTLVLPFTSLYQGGSACNPYLAAQIQQGNTFSVAFDMTKAPHAPGEDGMVTLLGSDESNYQPQGSLPLYNAGLSDKIAFVADGAPFYATVFGESVNVGHAYLAGTPNGDVFTWEAGVWLGDDCIALSGAASDAMAERFARSPAVA